MPDDGVDASRDTQLPKQKQASILPLFIAILLIPAVLGSSKTIFNDGDVSWHIATGQWILDHRAIPHTDPFSFTWFGRPWVPIEWLAEVIYAFCYRISGYGGVAALITLALIALHALVFLNASRWTRLATLPVIAMDFALIPMLSARPHVLTWPIIASWTWLMMKARQNDKGPPLIAALLMTLWANLHGSFVFGFVIAGAFGLEALVVSQDWKRALRQWLPFGMAAIAAVFINANGVEGVLHPLRFTQLQMLPLIDEWKPSSPSRTPFFFADLALVLGLIVWRRPRQSWVRWLLLASMLGFALLQTRHQAMFVILAATILPEAFGKNRLQIAPHARSFVWIITAATLLLVAVRAIMPLEPPENEANPWHLIAMVPASLRSRPVLNGYSMGGPLILSGIRPYVDGRGDMYGDQLVIDYARIIHGDRNAFERAVAKWDIRWAILPDQSRLIPLLDHLPDWRLLRRDRVGVIYVKGR